MSLARRKRLRFGKYSESQTGTVALFSLWRTAPWHIAKDSSLLGLHFATIGLILVLLVIYCGVAVYPLGSSLAAGKLGAEARITTSDGEDRLPGTCEKPASDAVLGNVARKTSVGNFCPPTDFSDVFDCASTCEVRNSAQLQDCDHWETATTLYHQFKSGGWQATSYFLCADDLDAARAGAHWRILHLMR